MKEIMKDYFNIFYFKFTFSELKLINSPRKVLNTEETYFIFMKKSILSVDVYLYFSIKMNFKFLEINQNKQGIYFIRTAEKKEK